MRLLLDTHVVLWSLARPERLSPSLRRVLTEQDNDLEVSVVSLWEIAIKEAVGKMSTRVDIRAELRERMIDELPVLGEHAIALGDLPPHHRDPFDRMLVAQARHEGLTLVTADRRLEAYSVAVLRADA